MAQDQLQLSESLLQLSELFPDIPLTHLSHILKVSNNSFDQAVEQSLNYDLIREDIEQVTKNSLQKQQQRQQEHHETQKPLNWVVIDSGKKKEDHIVKKKEKRIQQRAKYREDALATLQGQNENDSDSIGTSNDEMNGKISSSLQVPTSVNDDIALSGQSIQDALDLIKVKNLIKNFEMQDTVLDLLEIDDEYREFVEWYLEQNDYNKLKTIYDIMLNFDPKLLPSEQPRNIINTISFTKLMNFGNDTPAPNSVLMSDLIRGNMKNIYVSESDKCWDELQHLIEGNPELSLPKKFYMLAINWFKKDIYKVLNLAILLNDCFENKPPLIPKQNKHLNLGAIRFSDLTISNPNDSQSLGFDKNKSNTGGFDYNEYSNADNSLSSHSSTSSTLESLESRVRSLKNIRNRTNDKLLKTHYSNSIAETKQDIRTFHQTTQLSELENKINQAKRTFHIDLHSLSVQNAITALESVLPYWWDTEMHFRNTENTKFELTNVVHVEPFTIITGRGLHSGGGIPKIKIAALKFLQNNAYKFDEHASSIVVNGKRKN